MLCFFSISKSFHQCILSSLLLHCRTCRAPDCLWIMKLLFADGGRKTILHDALSKLVGAKCSTKTSITTPFHEITLNIIIVVAHFAVFCCGCISHACKKSFQCCILNVYWRIMNSSVTLWIEQNRGFFIHNIENVEKNHLLALHFLRVFFSYFQMKFYVRSQIFKRKNSVCGGIVCYCYNM